MKIIENIKAKLFGSKKNTAITLIVLAVALVGGIYLKGKLAKPAMEQMGTRTVEIKKSSITDVVTGSGSVKSKSVVNVTTSLTYKVKEILVQVGDTVKKGDIIAKLDNAEILKSINAEKTRLGELKKTAQENYDKSITEKNRSYDRAIASENEYNAAKKVFDEANAMFSKAQSSISQKQKEYDEAYKKSVTVGIEFNNLTTEKLKAEEKINALTAKETQAQSDYDNATDPADKAAKNLVLKAVQAEKAAAENSLVTITGKLTQKDGENKTAKADCATKEGELTAAKAACNFTALEANYTAAKATMDGARATFDGNEKSYDAAMSAEKAAKKTLDESSTSDVLKDLNEKLAQCIIKSDANGVITNINGVVGSSISTGILAVIQDTDNLVVSTSFKEYDVSNVKIGQKVIITSDATGEKEIIGTVSQLSMTSASSTDTSFPAEITINDRDTGLLIGMTAKIKVVLKEKNNIFVVPFDAVGLDANGDSVVYSQGADGKFSPIKVTTGESNDYEIEIISPDIKEGMIIRASADENAAGMMPGGAGAGGDMGGNMATMVG